MTRPTGYFRRMPQQIAAFPLRAARVHEVCGPLAASFVAVMAAERGGHVLWVREARTAETLVPQRLDTIFDVSKLVFARTGAQAETLAAAEEALRDGACPLVAMELSAPLGLTAGRRLQLAAQAGNATGLCLISEGMGANSAETRWRCAPLPDPENAPEDSTLQRWELIKNKSGTLGAWDVRWDRSARRLVVVSAARERPGSPGAPG